MCNEVLQGDILLNSDTAERILDKLRQLPVQEHEQLKNVYLSVVCYEVDLVFITVPGGLLYVRIDKEILQLVHDLADKAGRYRSSTVANKVRKNSSVSILDQRDALGEGDLIIKTISCD